MDMPKYVLNLMSVISFMDLFAVGLTFPVLAPYIRSLGLSHTAVGVLSSAYAALQVLSGPIIGSWSDVRGRKSVFLITLLLSSLCYLLLGMSSSVFWILIFRLLLGVFKHTQTLCKAVAGDFMKETQSAEVFGRSIAFGSLGFVVGPLIGGHLMEYERGFMYVCSVTAALFLINTGLVLRLPDVSSKQASKVRTLREEFSKTLTDLKDVDWSVHWVSFLLKFLYILATTIFFVNHSLYLKEKFNLPQKFIGYTISFVSIIGAISNLLQSRVMQKFYNPNSELEKAYHCFLVLTLCFIGFYLATNMYIITILLVPFGIFSALLRVVTMELLFKYSSDSGRGTLTGASDSVMAMARFVAPMSAGLFSDTFSENSVMLYAMFLCSIGTSVCFLLHRKTKNADKVK